MRPATRSSRAIPALCCGIAAVALAVVGFWFIGMIVGVAAAIIGGVAWQDTKQHGYRGEDLAIVAVVCGGISLAFGFMQLVSAAIGA